jgi:FlaA1/EpsC-like NDP-sugar epimerase
MFADLEDLLLLIFRLYQHNAHIRIPNLKMATPGPLFIIGTGPMIGSEIFRLFATKTFTHIALFARSESTLTVSKERIAASAPSATIKTYTADVINAGNLTEALMIAVIEIGPPEVVVYNAARINYVPFEDYNEEETLYGLQNCELRTVYHSQSVVATPLSSCC